jgi:CxxC motif-containing protein (DUF1111 family)
LLLPQRVIEQRSMRYQIALSLCLAAANCHAMPEATAFETRPAGAATYAGSINRNAFSHAPANMSHQRKLDFIVGKALFERLWVTAPASTQASDGLGPLYNARACERCHVNNGRGVLPDKEVTQTNSLLLKLSVPPRNEDEQTRLDSFHDRVIPEPTYGTQLQNFSTAGIPAEGQVVVRYAEVAVQFSDDRIINLRQPHYRIGQPGYGKPADDVMLSPRVAPQMIGLGLLEAIPDEALLRLADPADVDGDGISGKPNEVWSHAQGDVAIGRFGWKAGMATVNEQTQAAFFHDLGISTPFYPGGAGECSDRQTSCLEAPTGDSPQYNNLEAPQQVVELVSLYARSLAVPARRQIENPDVQKGWELFHQTGCHQCHNPTFTTRPDTDDPELAGQKIWPYTDLLLHDMGEELADHRPEGAASGREWRTAPLWGIGLTATVSGQAGFLHDGRARSILEAILWHGGEANAQREAVLKMNKRETGQLIRFIESL